MKKKFNVPLRLAIVLSLLVSAVASQTFTESNLPIVVINTGGQLADTAYQPIIVNMGIIDNGPGNTNHLSDPYNNYNGKIELRLRGTSSLGYPKKSFKITTLTAALVKSNVSLLGLPPEHDWVLKGIYLDKTLLRDDLTFRLHRQMGNYSSRVRYFELVINGSYRGVYALMEKIKRDAYRINIAKLKINETSGDNLTGGYIFKLDKFVPGEEGWYSSYNSNSTSDSANYFLYEYPKPDSMPQVQKDYIKDFVDGFEDVLASSWYDHPDTGYRKYINVASFIDNFILNELARNVDGYRASSYFYKDQDSRGDRKLHCGPLWDFELGWYNCSYGGGTNPAGWQYQQFYYGHYVPFWWWQLLSDPNFKYELRCRYQFLRSNVLDENNIFRHIDSMALYLDEAQARNFTKWPIIGQYMYPNPTPVPSSYAGEITNLKNWIHQRLQWLDANLPGSCIAGMTGPASSLNELAQYPNPFTENFSVRYSLGERASVRMDIIDLQGAVVVQLLNEAKPAGTYTAEIPATELAEGVYLLRLNAGGQVSCRRIVKMRE